ncbi:MAG: S8 family serine peptidase [Oligoflexia bacterium]|nr:S8 family serine peptidase [Oligoflexia bacterium]
MRYVFLFSFVMVWLLWRITLSAGELNSSFISDYLVKLDESSSKDTLTIEEQNLIKDLKNKGAQIEFFNDLPWFRVILKKHSKNSINKLLKEINSNPVVNYVQPNYKIKLQENYQIQDPILLNTIAAQMKANPLFAKAMNEKIADNPNIPSIPIQRPGVDPKFTNQWGMKDIGVLEAHKITKGSPDMIVAVIDTGVDYTHEDLVANIWKNNREMGLDTDGKDKSSNGIDDDGNGYIDDVIGWDFVQNDNKPFDLTTSIWEMIMGGGNPGHGTHCAGNVAAHSDNSLGIIGVAPNVRIMPLRFLSEKGEGSTADALKAIQYAIANGARVLSNSWGSEGEDSSEGQTNQALRDVITYAGTKGVLFIAAAGNGHNGVGYDNDADAKPGYPASYDMENIISVAAIDLNNNLGSFSNWGKKSVDLAAPGVRVYSTVPGNIYNDVVLDFMGTTVYWDGTSMAAPHVSGAAALYWSKYPNKSWSEVKNAILNSTQKIPSMNNKSVTGGKLNVSSLLI